MQPSVMLQRGKLSYMRDVLQTSGPRPRILLDPLHDAAVRGKNNSVHDKLRLVMYMSRALNSLAFRIVKRRVTKGYRSRQRSLLQKLTCWGAQIAGLCLLSRRRLRQSDPSVVASQCWAPINCRCATPFCTATNSSHYSTSPAVNLPRSARSDRHRSGNARRQQTRRNNSPNIH